MLKRNREKKREKERGRREKERGERGKTEWKRRRDGTIPPK